MNWVDCHCHSHGSTLDGYGTAKQHVQRVLELGQPAIAVCDHGTISQHYEFQREAQKAGLRPCLGVEFYLADDVTQLGKQKGSDRRQGEKRAARYAHLSAIAQSQRGYQNLLKLVSLSHDHVYYKPQVDPLLIAEYAEGCAILSGCVIGRPSQLINAGELETAALWLEFFRDNVEQFYVELIPCEGLAISEFALPILWELATILGIPTVATSDAHAPRPEDMIAQNTLQAANTGQKVNDPNRTFKLPAYHHRCSGSDMLNRLRACLPVVPDVELVAAIERSVEIAERCEAECPRGTGVRFTVPDGFTADSLLRKLAYEGLERKLDRKWVDRTQSMMSSTDLPCANQKTLNKEILDVPKQAVGNIPSMEEREASQKVSATTDTEERWLTEETGWSTISSTNSSEDQFQEDLSLTISAETDVAQTQTIWNLSHQRKTYCEETEPQPSTLEKFSVKMDTYCVEKTSPSPPREGEGVESAQELKPGKNSGATTRKTLKSSEKRHESTEEKIQKGFGVTTESVEVDKTLYLNRLDHELAVICEKGFADYFLISADLVREMRSRGILVVPRGSAGGSLVLWALDITIPDPLEHNLSFDRFLDRTRTDLPDCDIDIEHTRRWEAFEFLEERYGADHVAHVSTLSRFGARQALLDVAKTHELPEGIVAQVALLVPEGEDADQGLHDWQALTRLFETNTRAKVLLAKCPQLAIAAQLEGQVRQFSVHAGGALIDDTPLREIVAVAHPAGKERTALVDMATAANQGLLKLDLLGSKSLTAIAETAKELAWPLERVYELPLNDPTAMQMLTEGRGLGVFQLQGAAAGRIMRDLQPERFEDLVAVSALARPGPLQSGAVKHFVARHRGEEPVPPLHPGLAEILRLSYGLVIFQEEAMALAALAGFELADVHKVRKIVSKVGGAAAMEEHFERLAAGWFAAGVSVDEAAEAWTQLQRAAGYAFCRAHAVQYGFISAWTAYLKAHHPAIYTAALARNMSAKADETAEERQFALLREFTERGGQVRLLDPNAGPSFAATGEWSLVGGWQNLRGVGSKIAAKMAALPGYESWGVLLEDPQVPSQVRKAVEALGLATAYLDSDAIERFAPWFPSRPLTCGEVDLADELRAIRLAVVARTQWSDRAEVLVLGRVTQVKAIDLALQFKKYGGSPPRLGETEKARLTLTDEEGSVEVGFSARVWKAHRAAGFRPAVGDTVAGRVWYHAELGRWYARKAEVTRRLPTKVDVR